MKSFLIGLLLAFLIIGCVSQKHTFQPFPTVAKPLASSETNLLSLGIRYNTNLWRFQLIVTNAVTNTLYGIWFAPHTPKAWTLYGSGFTAASNWDSDIGQFVLTVNSNFSDARFYFVGNDLLPVLGGPTNVSDQTNCCYTNDVPPEP